MLAHRLNIKKKNSLRISKLELHISYFIIHICILLGHLIIRSVKYTKNDILIFPSFLNHSMCVTVNISWPFYSLYYVHSSSQKMTIKLQHNLSLCCKNSERQQSVTVLLLTVVVNVSQFNSWQLKNRNNKYQQSILVIKVKIMKS